MPGYKYRGENFTMKEIADTAARLGVDMQTYVARVPGLEYVRDPIDDKDVSWFDQTWLGRGIAAASTTGEAANLLMEGSNVDIETVREFMQAKEEEAKNYVPSKDMEEFQKKYNEEGKTWSAFFRGVKRNPKLMAELFVQSLGTQVGTFFDSDEARKATIGAGTAGAIGTAYTGYGALVGGAVGAMGGLATSMEAALTFGELIEKELQAEGKEFTDENIKALLEGPKGQKIRNRSVGRGLAIGTVEALSGGLAVKATKGVTSAAMRSIKEVGRGGKRAKLAGTAAGVGVEAIGGGTGEVLGRVAADQEMDPAEIGFEAITGTVTAPITVGLGLKSYKKPKYELNNEEVTYAAFKEFIDTADEIDVAKAKIKIENDFTGIGKKAQQKQNRAIYKAQIDEKVTDEQDINDLVKLGEQLDAANREQNKKGLSKAKKELAAKKAEQIQNKMDAITDKYDAVGFGETQVGQEVRDIQADFNFEANMEFAKKHSELYGYEFDDTLTPEQIAEKYGAKFKDSNGFITKDNKIIINKQVAKNKEFGMNVGNHELLHGIIRASGKKDLITDATIKSFMEIIGQEGRDAINQRIKENSDVYNDEYMKKNKDEYFTLYSDAIENGDINFNDNLFNKIGNVVRGFFNDLGYSKVDFTDARSAYNFLKDYNKSIHKGALAKGTKKATTPVGVTDPTDPADAPMSISRDASDKVQKIYEDQGTDGAFDIIEQFKPIVSRIADKRKNAPNFDKELLMSEIELGPRGLLDLINTYDPTKGVPLAAYINKNLPNRAIEASKRILGEEFTADVTEAKGVIAEETTDVETTPTPKKEIVLSERLNIVDKVKESIGAAIATINLDNVNFKTLKDVMPEITSELFGIPVKKLISGANLTKNELRAAQMFINKNADLLISMLPEGATAGGTATGIPNTLLKAFYTKTERAKAAQTGSRAGLPIQQKRSITKKEFLETFGIIDGKPTRADRNISARALAIANLTGKMISNQSVRQKLAEVEQTEQIIQKISDGKSDVMFSTSSKLNQNIPLGTELNARNSKHRTQVFNFLRDVWPNFLPPIYPADTFGPHTGIEKNIKKNFMLDASDRAKLKFSKLKNKLTADQVAKVKAFLTDKRNKFDKIGTEAYSKLIEDHFEGATIFFEGLAKMYKKGFGPEIMAILATSGQSTGHIVRILGLPKGISNDIKVEGNKLKHKDKNQKGTPIKDHTLQTTNATGMLGKAIVMGPKAVKNLMKYFKEHYYMIALSHTDDTTVNKFYKTKQVKEFTDMFEKNFTEFLKTGNLSLMPDPVLRLVHPDTNIDISKIKMADGRTLRDKYFGADNEAIFKYLKGEVNENYLKQNSKIQQAPQSKSNDIFNKAIVNNQNKNYTVNKRGMSTFDFDETLIIGGKNFVTATLGDEVIKVSSGQWPIKGPELMEQGYKFDFKDFVNVRGGVSGPLLQKMRNQIKKYGPSNVFVLTARMQDADTAIHGWLKSKGINIPLKNITGLGNSTGEAKARWMLEKFAQGYNDMYFVDDALPNVKAVKHVLSQLDVKSNVQQVKSDYAQSTSQDKDFNQIIEDVKGIDANKRYGSAKARRQGRGKGIFRFFIPPSHEDFIGLLYNFMGKGRLGDKHRAFFEENLIKPLNRAYLALNTAKQAIASDYKNLLKTYPGLRKKLTRKLPGEDLTYGDAVRIYLWDKFGFDIPGLTKTEIKEIVDVVKNDAQLQVFADTVGKISRVEEGYVQPDDSWEAGDIMTDLADATGRIGRKKFFAEFIKNVEVIFSPENLNKIEAAFGSNFRQALEDVLYRTINGTNRKTGSNRIVNGFLDYLNGSVGATMFFNMRSAVLQQLSFVNFINFADNNIFMAAKAFANQKQFWTDYLMLFNSDMLKQRRAGVSFDVNANELASIVARSKQPVRALIKLLLQKGFLPTQIADSNAIALGGASFYRNRVNTYIKQGLSKVEAETKAFQDFQEVAESTQQSARPDMISQQQASPLGRLILAFQNVTSQYARLTKKSALDLINRRKSPPYTNQTQSDMANLSRIVYYGAVQSLVFYGLQTALFAAMFGVDDEENEKFFKRKEQRVISGGIDGILRGLGIGGAVISTLKNVAVKFTQNQDKSNFIKSKDPAWMQILSLSPPVDIKIRKLKYAERDFVEKGDIMKQMDTFDIDNPVWSATSNLIEGTTNIPLNRLHEKVHNIRAAMDDQNEWWQRLFMWAGWSRWNFGIENEEVEAVKKFIKENNSNVKKGKKKFTI